MGEPIVSFDLLSSLPHFSGADETVVREVARSSRMLSLEKGEWLFRQGDPCRAFFLVCTGAVRVFRLTPDGREQVIHQIKGGQTFAEAALLTMPVYPVHAVAAESPTQVLEIGGDTFLRLFDADRSLARGMAASLCTWLLRLVQRVEELTVSSAGARLARYLLDLPGSEADGAIAVNLPMAKKDIAAHLGITPETLSRQLRKWADRGIVTSTRNVVEIHDADMLMAVAASP